VRATKCVTQSYEGDGLRELLAECLTITYSGINYGQEYDIDNRKAMKGFYQRLKGAELPSSYKIAAITRACSVLRSRKKSGRRGVETRHPKALRPMVCIISGFFVTMKGRLFIPLRRDKYFDIQLNHHVLQRLSGMKVRSLTITPDLLSFCYSEEVEQIPLKTVFGIDRNEKNLTFGNREEVIQIDMAMAVRIRETTREILASFKRNDVRVRRRLTRKYWKRANDRTDQLLHVATNLVVDSAARNGAALALEDLTGIRNMYLKGNGHGSDYRFRLNSWQQHKVRRMLGYKAAWKGVTMIPLTKSETYGSSSVHSACGEKLHRPKKGDAEHRRMLWCQTCKIWEDRDANATIVLSQRGLARFASSLPKPKSRSQQALEAEEKGLAGEAVKGNGTKTLILRVDASKLTHRPMVNSTIDRPKS
jgi:putative transposase